MSGFIRPERHQTLPFTRATHLGSSKSDLERDSGFSDASSEYLSAVDLTDSEDAGRKGSVVGQDPNGVQVAVIGGSYAGLSPMIIMNNFILKQPSQMAPAEKQWGFPPPLDVMPQSQMVLLQPMVSNSNGGSGGSPKTGGENPRQSKGYAPILKSYPRIAPHPGEPPSKRSGSSRMRGSSGSGYEQRQRRRHHSQRHHSSPSPQPAPHTPNKAIANATSNQSAPPADLQELGDKCLSPLTGFGALPAYMLDGGGGGGCAEAEAQRACDDSNKLQRFSNTYNILNKCGLLGITMRTKQLIKENKRTQGQVQQLREQTALLLEALGSGDPQLWTRLQASLQSTDREQCAVKAHRDVM